MANVIKNFGYTLQMFVKRWSVYPWQAFQPSFMFASMARAYLGEAPLKYSTLG
jgi:hypothetical protein